MVEFLVTCIRRDVRSGTHVGVTHLGGPEWLWSKDDVVGAIDAGEHAFYMMASGRRVEIAVVPGALSRYVRCRADQGWTDDLLALPQCADG